MNDITLHSSLCKQSRVPKSIPLLFEIFRIASFAANNNTPDAGMADSIRGVVAEKQGKEDRSK